MFDADEMMIAASSRSVKSREVLPWASSEHIASRNCCRTWQAKAARLSAASPIEPLLQVGV